MLKFLCGLLSCPEPEPVILQRSVPEREKISALVRALSGPERMALLGLLGIQTFVPMDTEDDGGKQVTKLIEDWVDRRT